jgi:hypothetical protein
VAAIVAVTLADVSNHDMITTEKIVAPSAASCLDFSDDDSDQRLTNDDDHSEEDYMKTCRSPGEYRTKAYL